MGTFEIGIMCAVFLFGCASLGYALHVQDGLEKRLREIEEEWKKLAAGWEDLAKTTELMASAADSMAEEEKKLVSLRRGALAIVKGKNSIN